MVRTNRDTRLKTLPSPLRSVADPVAELGVRNMKSILPSVAVFFMTYFYRAGGTLAPWAPLDPLLPLVDGNNAPMVLDKNKSSAMKIVI